MADTEDSRERERAWFRAYYQANRQRKIEHATNWNKANPERHWKAQRKWNEANAPRVAFKNHRAGAKARGIEFLLTFEEWWAIWRDSGKWTERGRRKGQYVMARFADRGPYAVGNVRICTTTENNMEQGANLSQEARSRRSEILKRRHAARRHLARLAETKPRTCIVPDPKSA